MLDQSEETRRIYHEQHKRIVNDDRAMARFIGMFSTDYFGVDPDWFASKRCLDAGCGDTAKLLIALYQMGCRDLHGFDLGEDFMPVAQGSLAAHGASANLKSGSVLAIPHHDADFDFVSCHGVLVHLNNLDEAERGFRELARVTKTGGSLYTVFGLVGGFMEDCLLPAARAYYRSNPAFKKLIDEISPDHFGHLVDLVEAGLLKHEGAKVSLDAFRDMLDVDLCVLFQNAIQCPVRLSIDEATIRRMYAENGFAEPRRLRRYVKRKNIRRFTAPLHYERDDPTVKLIYGSGNLEFIAVKA